MLATTLESGFVTSNHSHIKQKRSLSQVFLKVDWPSNQIVDILESWGVQHVLEIGPGGGALTQKLLAKNIHVTAIEKDTRFAENLAATISDEKFQIINEDILKFDIANWLSEKSGEIAIIGNIPYKISTQIVIATLPFLDQLKGVLLMTQLEFANRICAENRTKDYGSITVYSQLRSQATLEFKVPKDCFKPIPKVDSAVISLKPIKLPCDQETLDFTEKIVREAFTKRRKKLKNALGKFLDETIDLNIDLSQRPEDITPLEYVEIAKSLIKNKNSST